MLVWQTIWPKRLKGQLDQRAQHGRYRCSASSGYRQLTGACQIVWTRSTRKVLEFYNQFMGSDAPKLEGTRFSVLSLGDSSYEHFCKMGKISIVDWMSWEANDW